MKIGILSMQEVTNYGSFLQAYGLKKIIESLGHEVEFINIVPGKQLSQYKLSKFHKIRILLRRLKVKNPIKQLLYTLKLHQRFDKEFKPELGVPKGCKSSFYDVVVIGSDEVFNVAQSTWFGFSPQLFGQGLKTNKVISYAGSFGATTLDKLKELGIAQQVGKLMQNMASISIRDLNSFNVVKSLVGKEPNLNVDPVIAYDFVSEIRQPNISTPYLFIYTYPGRIRDNKEIAAIVNFAKKNNLMIIANANYFDWVDKIVTPHPFEVLGFFKNANYIITDTFHGAVMSLKYNKSFAVIVRDMNSNKLSFLMDQFGLKRLIAQNPNEIDRILSTDIDYSRINAKIIQERRKTYEYLRKNTYSPHLE